MNANIVMLFAVAALVNAGDDFHDDNSLQNSQSYESHEARYDFDWAVKDDYGNNYGHQETRHDDHTSGSYFVHLPDGRIQKVTYYVDGDSGFVANVEYEGVASFPTFADSYETNSLELSNESDEHVSNESM